MCAMNPRLLRPLATGFNPRSISGLALWLDGADGSTLFQNSDGTTPATETSDPVGYWGDKSGNNRHATQATAAQRGAVGSQNGRKAISLGGTDDHLLLGDLSAAFPSAATLFAVVNPGSDNSYNIYQTRNNTAADRFGSGSFAGAFRTTRTGNSSTRNGLQRDGVLLWGVESSSSGWRSLVNGVPTLSTAADYNAGDNHAIGIRTETLDNTTALNGTVCEVIAYSRVLSAAERRRAELHLARKWGITLAPQVSNADAQDWVNRVYANGGTVSPSTAAAVNTFCAAIDAASIRDRFYRLNLFCGTGLNAALVPLYRGPTYGGTTYGNATDTNNGPFVSGDYNETGASGGLTATSNTSKYLETGLIPFDAGITEQNYHNSGYFPAILNTNAFFIGQISNSGTSLYAPAFGTAGMYVRFGGGSNSGLENAALAARSGHLIGQRSGGTGVGYRNGSNINGTSITTSNAVFASGQTPLFVFATNNTTGSTSYWSGRASMYSIGLDFSDAQALAFYNAAEAFQTALGRQL